MTVRAFFDGLPYEPDDFQLEAGFELESGQTVVVTAPTGAGKTIVAEAAIHLALESGRRIFYTTPIKALSNQKFNDLRKAHGDGRVGLLTGDNVINGDGQIVVMTTEVLRNMIYADDHSLDDVGFVVLDEVHYLQDRFRGAVWEEVIIHAPRHVQMVCLSATVANAVEFSNWIRERRGPTSLVQTTHRPVPLETIYMVQDRMGEDVIRTWPLFVSKGGRQRPNPNLEHAMGLEKGRRRRYGTPRRLEVLMELEHRAMTPAIHFIFSRAGCDAAALRVLESGARLTTPEERDEIREVATARTAHLSDGDLAALDFGRWVSTLEVGAGAHHAGLVPAFKEAVEELFAAGLLRVVYATETLALGINMPARTVVIDALSKYDGEGHSLLQPGDFTQLTGRAGRRGIDTAGYGIVLHSKFVRLDQVVKIAEAGAHPLRSSFRPTYNMAANLIANYPEHEADRLLASSFAQFLRSGEAGRMADRIAALESSLADQRRRAECDLGSIDDYLTHHGTRRRSRDGEDDTIQQGDVIDVHGTARQGRYVVLASLAPTRKGDGRHLVMSTSGKVSPMSATEMGSSPRRLGRIPIPDVAGDGPDRAASTQIRDRLRTFVEHGDRVSVADDHAVAACPHLPEHLSWANKAARTERRLRKARAELRSGAGGILEEFALIRRLLESWNYVDGWSLTTRGDRLRFVYNEMDLLLTEACERGLLDGLEPAQLAAVASLFVFEPRTEDPPAPVYPDATTSARHDAIVELWDDLAELEKSLTLGRTRRPDAGFAEAAYRWASGSDLADLEELWMQPGDFVRVCRQLVDLLRQLRDAFPPLFGPASAALRAIDRGVVAAQGS